MTTLASKVALVTGASRGIGSAISQTLAAAGAKVALVARNEDSLRIVEEAISSAGGTAIGYLADVTDRDRTEEIVDRCTEELGPIDILVNNAGLGGTMGPIWESDVEKLWDAFTVNTRGPILYTQAVLKQMVPRKSGLILNMGSYASIRPSPYSPGYAASKAALARFSDSVAETVAEHGVSVLTLSPGLVLTDMTQDSEYFKKIPSEVWSSIDEISELVLNLAQRDCTTLNGAFIHVNDEIESLFENAEKIREQHLYSLRLSNLNGIID